MKYIFKLGACFLLFITSVFSSCSTETNNVSYIDSSSKMSALITSSDFNSNANHIDPISKWNTTLLQNHKNNASFFYNDISDEIFYCKDEIVNGKLVHSLMVRSDTDERKIVDTYAQSIYVLDQTIYFSTETGIQSIQTDGSNAKTILTLSMDTPARYIYPYKDTLFYLSDNWQIHQVNLSDLTQKVLTTSESVFYYMIYNDCIYYAGFLNELRGLSCSLRRYDIKTGEDTELVKNISAFDILNDTIYIFDQDGVVSRTNINGKQQEVLFLDKDLYTDSMYVTETGLLYFTMKNDGSRFFNKYNFYSKEHEEICSVEVGEWSLCGKYLCSYAPYDPNGETYHFKTFQKHNKADGSLC